jgi:hypothetical protein
MARRPVPRKMLRFSGVTLIAGGAVLATVSPALAAGPTEFTPGDLVVYETLGTSHAAQAVDLVDYSVSSTPITGTTTASPGYSVALPIADNSGTGAHAVTDSGSALNDGELTLSADGQNLVATGYDAVPGYDGGVKITGALGVPRTVAIVSQTGSVDTSTSLTDSQTEGTGTANNFRSATQAVAGGNIYTGGDGGLGITTDGSSTDSYLNTTDSVHEVQALNGNVYDSTSSNINEVPSTGGLPTSGTQADSPLLSGANLPAHFDPDQFAFVNLGSGTGPDTLYVADGAGGTTPCSSAPCNNLVEKYSLESGVWTATGSITVPQVVGLAADVTTSSGDQKVANIFVTGATSTSAGNNTVLSGFTDTSGYEGTLTGSFTQLATAPVGDDFKGLAFAPATALPNNGDTPEVPLALVLPIVGGAILAGGVFWTHRRRRNTAAPSIAL